MRLRHASMEDLDVLAAIEAASYPKAEGASRESLRGRLTHFPHCFWLLEDDEGQTVAFINGMLTHQSHLTDAMYDAPSLHDDAGAWLMIFSVVTRPDCRGRGYAALLMERVISDMTAQGRRGIVLTCKERLLPFYTRFGYRSEGLSDSTHGAASWYQMRLRLDVS